MRTPLCQFINFVRPLEINAAIVKEDTISDQQLLNIPTVNGTIIGGLFNYNYPVHPVHFDSRPYLPPHLDTVIRFDIIGRNTYLEFLKHIIFVVSNNIDTELVDKLVVILAKDAHARNLFARLISQNLASLKVCIERFWFPAVQHGHRALMQILIERRRQHQPPWWK
jgi:hypothetical protein